MENNQENVTQSIESQPPKPFDKKWIITISLILVGTLVVVGGYLIYQKLTTKSQIYDLNSAKLATSTEQYADWQTYRSNEFEIFEIKYPKNWIMVTNDTHQLILESPERHPHPSRWRATDWMPTEYTWSSHMGITVYKDSGCRDQTNSEFEERMHGLSSKTVCVSGMEISEYLYLDEPNKVEQQKELLTNIISTFKFIGKKQFTKEQLENRILLTEENIPAYAKYKETYQQGELPRACEERFNYDTANSTTTYSSGKWGISFEIPYNVNWGNEKYKINPYEEISAKPDWVGVKAQVVYGYLFAGEGCAWEREGSLSIMDKEFRSNIVSSTTENINGLQVIKYNEEGMCDYSTLRIVGKKYAYEFTSLCNGGFEDIEKIVKTVKLINQ